jgi:hypothetical protein
MHAVMTRRKASPAASSQLWQSSSQPPPAVNVVFVPRFEYVIGSSHLDGAYPASTLP